MSSNKGEDLIRLLLVDVATGDVEFVDADPGGEVDLGVASFADANGRLFATVYVGDRLRIYPRTSELADENRLAQGTSAGRPWRKRRAG